MNRSGRASPAALVASLRRSVFDSAAATDPRTRQALKALTAVDGTLLRAVPRMAWARAGGPTSFSRQSRCGI